MRTLQFVRAPSLLQDYRTLENAIGDRLPRAGGPPRPLASHPGYARLYRFGLDRGSLDAFLIESIVSPFVRALRRCDALERRWTDFLAGEASRESDRVKPHAGNLDEFL
jgi:NAD(P)H-quinone oxidoreductase subunit 5